MAAADVAARPGQAPRASRAVGRAWLWGTIGLSAAAFALAMALAPPASAPPGRGLTWLLFATPRRVMDWFLLPYFGWQFCLHAVTPVLRVLFPVARLAFGVAVVTGIALLVRRRQRSPSTPGFAVAYLMALAFFGPVFAPLLTRGSPYAAVGGLTIAHGLQYLLLTSLLAASGSGYARNGSGDNALARALRLALLLNVVLIGGAILAAGSHLDESSGIARAGYGAYLGVVMAHFVIDAGLWRLRDPFPRQFLTGRLPYLFRPPMDRKAI